MVIPTCVLYGYAVCILFGYECLERIFVLHTEVCILYSMYIYISYDYVFYKLCSFYKVRQQYDEKLLREKQMKGALQIN